MFILDTDLRLLAHIGSRLGLITGQYHSLKHGYEQKERDIRQKDIALAQGKMAAFEECVDLIIQHIAQQKQ